MRSALTTGPMSSADAARRSGRTAPASAVGDLADLAARRELGVAGRRRAGRRRRRGRRDRPMRAAEATDCGRRRWRSALADGRRARPTARTPDGGRPTADAAGRRRRADGAGPTAPTPTRRRCRRGRGSGPASAVGGGVAQADRLGLDVDEAVARRCDRRVAEALADEDRLDLVGGDVRSCEADLPARAAGVVDRELEALLPPVERGQEDEDQARDRDERARRGRTSGACR